MTTTTTQGATDMTTTTSERCGQCGDDFPTLVDVFAHECSGSRRRFATVPNGFGGTTTVRNTPASAPTATERQVSYLRSLGFDGDTDNMTKAAASAAIDNLLRNKVAEVPAAAPQGVRTNRYAGSCGTCHTNVPEGAGRIVNTMGKWVVFHTDGKCPEATPAAPVAPLPDVPAGHYAVTSATGNNDFDFFRVDRPTDGAWAGRTFVKRVIGGQADAPVRGAQGRDALDRILEAGPEAAAMLYGQTIGRCGRCNRHLTDETSRALGLGPDCATRGF